MSALILSRLYFSGEDDFELVTTAGVAILGIGGILGLILVVAVVVMLKKKNETMPSKDNKENQDTEKPKNEVVSIQINDNPLYDDPTKQQN